MVSFYDNKIAWCKKMRAFNSIKYFDTQAKNTWKKDFAIQPFVYRIHVNRYFGKQWRPRLWHFIRVCTVCLDKTTLQKKKYNIIWKIIPCDPFIYSMDHPKFIVSNQNEESVGIQRVTENDLKFRTHIACKKCLDKQWRPRSDCFWRSSLIRVFPDCYSDNHFVDSKIDNQHFIWEQSKGSVQNFKTYTVKPVLSNHSKIDKTKILMTNGSLIKVKSIAECSPWSILQYFWPALSDNWAWKPIFFWEWLL